MGINFKSVTVKIKILGILILIFSFSNVFSQENSIPEKFIIHRVKKGEDIDELSNKYNLTRDQIEDFKDIPIEIYENKYPVTIRNYGIRKDTGGPGKMRGGCGLYKEYTVNTDLNLSLWFDKWVGLLLHKTVLFVFLRVWPPKSGI